MKKLYKVIAIILVIALLFFGSGQFHKRKAYADGLTSSIIAGCSYALMDSWGISFTAGNASSFGMSGFMTEQVESYVNSHGGSIASLFGGEMARNVAGKLVVGHEIYNGVKDFVDWLSDAYDLSDVDFSLSDGYYGDVPLNKDIEGSEQWSGVGAGAYFTNYSEPSQGYPAGYARCYYMNGSSSVYNVSAGSGLLFTGSYTVYRQNNAVYVSAERVGRYGAHAYPLAHAVATVTDSDINNSLSWNGAGYVAPVVLNPTQGWEGTIPGAPDTNLEDLIGHIFEGVADNNLVVDGEVIDIPVPPPTPVPVDPDTPLSDVPWEGLDTNLQNLYNQGLEEIGKIGEAQDAITDAVSDQTGALEGAIADNAGVVSGAIDQAVSDIQDAIGEQTTALDESLSATAEATETIAEALEDEAINWQKFDLRGLFPFCIPFDIYNMLDALDASPTAPHVQLPFVIESIGFSYTIDLDFSAFDTVAAVMRQMELIVYGIALAWATSKVIKW